MIRAEFFVVVLKDELQLGGAFGTSYLGMKLDSSSVLSVVQEDGRKRSLIHNFLSSGRIRFFADENNVP